ncbi:hypothetical protein M2650_06055 [Luteimonas sp. SX5]|uniref:DUF4345 domain-containing protein n=1 Tax=Luteimonas galliterrae TaxID=2940486 RepID=A0ABT0MH54_9GAMM|nr:hypothetical protein [Luteimonas galliterrae]MCL1634194.1 hypothetical protein [Luteimonas galliterrae]
MGRTIAGAVVGLAVAMAAIFLVEALATAISPPPPGLDLTNEADLARMVELATPAMKAMVVFGWLLASFVGGWVAAKISRSHRVAAAIVVGIGVVAGVILNATMLPHPLWMTVLGVALPIPLAWYAARLATPRATL